MYRLVQFGRQSLAAYNQVDVIGSGETPTSYFNLVEGGALDLFGSQQKHPGAVERTLSRRLSGASVAEVEALYFQLLALRGTRDRLFRRTASGQVQWMYARLVELVAKRDYQQTPYKRLQDLELRFVTQENTWHGAYSGAWNLDAGYYLDEALNFDSGQSYPLTASPMSLGLTLGAAADAGRAPVRSIRITVSAGATAITAFSLARAGGETLSFGGTIASGKQLIIDTGTLQVTNDGADAYDSLTFAATADLAAWFTLQPGNNALTMTYTGGGTGKAIDFIYHEAWY